MFFDIIIPTHGRPYLLKRAVKSIRRQKFDDVRLIIISDDPQSHALESVQSLLKPHDLFIQRLNATGPAASRNEGLKHVNAEFVLFLDDDDTYAENFLKDLHHALQTTQGDVFVIDFDVAREYRDDDYADVYKFERWYPSFESMDFKQIYVKNFIPNNAVVYRSNTLKNKQFNNEIGYEDWDFLLSVFSEFELVYLPVRGAVVHKMNYEASDSRGAKTREDVLETAIYIYQKYPIVDTSLLKLRKGLFESMGLDYDEIVVHEKNNGFSANSLTLIDAFNHGDYILKKYGVQAAINFYNQWLENNNNISGRYVIFHQLGYFYLQSYFYRDALYFFKKSIEISPKFHYSRIALVEVLLKLAEIEQALQHLAWIVDPINNIHNENEEIFIAAHDIFWRIILRDKNIPIHTNGVNEKIVFSMWFGKADMSSDRKNCLLSIVQNNQCHNEHITDDTLAYYLHPDYPLHPIFPYLSPVHQSDYLRCYMMHIYGGGYTDIKKTSHDWRGLFNKMSHSDMWVCGYTEIAPHGVAPVGGVLESEMKQNYQKLIGFCSFICKPNTPFTKAWLDGIHKVFDEKYEDAKTNPARHPLDRTGIKFGDNDISKYPLAWTEIGGNVFHPLVYQYQDKILHAVEIMPSFKEYR